MSEQSWGRHRDLVAARLRAGGVASADAEARWICESVSGFAGTEWLEVARQAPTTRQAARLDALVERRLGGEPLQYVLGEWAFRDLDLLVDPRVLIPRPETEWVVELALRAVPAPRTVVDLGTGSGAIALSIARARPEARVHAADLSADALAVARLNGAGNGVRNVEFHAGDWYGALPAHLAGSIDLVVANPPYVATTERDDLPREVVDHEPALALFGGPDGFDALRVVIGEATSWIAPHGVLVVEHAPAQAEAVVALARSVGLVDARVEPDLTGRPRALVARA